MAITDRAAAATDAVSTGPDRSHRRRPIIFRCTCGAWVHRRHTECATCGEAL